MVVSFQLQLLTLGLAALIILGVWIPPASAEEIQLTPNPSIQEFQNRMDDVKPYDFDAPPQGMVRAITFAEGFDEEIGVRRTHEIVPVNVRDIFRPDAAVYVVYSVFPHYESFQFFGRCFAEDVPGLDPAAIIAEDVMYMALEDESGYVKFHPPTGGWRPGRYKVEIHVGWKINDISLLGTMRFTVQDYPTIGPTSSEGMKKTTDQ